MVYNLSFINYVGGQDGRVFDEMKHLNKSKEVRNLTGEWITTDLKEDIVATKHQTEGMQRMTTDLKKDIMATNLTNVHQTKEMQRMTADLKKDIMATKKKCRDATDDHVFKKRNNCYECKSNSRDATDDRGYKKRNGSH